MGLLRSLVPKCIPPDNLMSTAGLQSSVSKEFIWVPGGDGILASLEEIRSEPAELKETRDIRRLGALYNHYYEVILSVIDVMAEETRGTMATRAGGSASEVREVRAEHMRRLLERFNRSVTTLLAVPA